MMNKFSEKLNDLVEIIKIQLKNFNKFMTTMGQTADDVTETIQNDPIG